MKSPFDWKGQSSTLLTARDKMPYKRPVDPPASSQISIEPMNTEKAQNRSFNVRQHYDFGVEE